MRTCLFCPTAKTTKEHVFPEWLVEEYRKAVPRQPGRYTATRTQPDGTRRIRLKGDITETAHLACKSCNDTWMSRVENRAKRDLLPLINNAAPPPILDRAALARIAAWMTLRSMIFDASVSQTPGRHYTPQERDAFRRSDGRTPPPNTQIWLTIYPGPSHGAKYTVTNNLMSEAASQHTVTCVLNRLAFKLVAIRGPQRSFDPRVLAVMGHYTRRIWPTRRRPIDWPPTHTLSRQMFKAFENWLKP